MLQMFRRCPLGLLVSALLCCVFIIPGAAAGYPDAAQKGTITVNIDATGTMTLYQAAQYNDETHRYQTSILFEDSGFDPEHLSADDAVDLWEFIQALDGNAPIGVTYKISSGTVQFKSLPLGIYLLVHKGPSGDPAALPFFVTIPMRADGAYIYDITADSKVRLVTPAPVSPSPTPTPSPSPSGSPSPEPTEPEPTEPEPTEPEPTEPEPTEPEPTEPEPSEPEPSEPEPTEPEPTEPVPTDPDMDFFYPDEPISDIPEPDISVPPEPLPSLPELSPVPSYSASGSASNSSGRKLPNTGQLNWPIPVLVVLGLILFGLGWYLHQGRRGGK